MFKTLGSSGPPALAPPTRGGQFLNLIPFYSDFKSQHLIKLISYHSIGTMTDLRSPRTSAYSIERFDDKLPGLYNTILKFLRVLLNILDDKLRIYVWFHRHKETLNIWRYNTTEN